MRVRAQEQQQARGAVARASGASGAAGPYSRGHTPLDYEVASVLGPHLSLREGTHPRIVLWFLV